MGEKRIHYLCLEQLRDDGAARVHVGEIVENLEKRGWQITLHALRPGRRRRPLPLRLPVLLLVQFRLIAACRRDDIIFVRANMLAFLVALFAWLRGVPIVHEVNGSYRDAFVAYPWLSPFAAILRLLRRWQYRRASHLIGVTDGLAAWLRTEGGHDRVSVISNGANIDLFRPDAPRANDAPSGNYVVFSGGMAEWHGREVMLAAIASDDWPADVSLFLLGGGSAKNTAEMDYPDHPNLVVGGRVPYERVARYLAGAIAGLVPLTDPGGRSATGLAPLKLFEFMACGLPVIVSDLPGQSQIVRQHGCGSVIPVGDARALARAVAAVAADPAAAGAMGARGAAVVRRRYSWAASAEKLDRLLSGITARTEVRYR